MLSKKKGVGQPTPFLSIVIPAYNEEENIKDVIEKSVEFGKKLGKPCEVIVVDDGSKDRTFHICKELAEKYPELRCIRHERNKGKAGALKTGFKEAKGEYIFYTDADNQYDINELLQYINLFGKYDILSGYRLNKAISPFRRFASWLYNVIARKFLGVKARDIECAFKVFRSKVIKNIPIKTKGFMVETEILARATVCGYSIHDIPVHHYARRKGKTAVSPLKEALRSLLGLYLIKKEILKIKK